MLLIGLAVRFVHFALFEADLVSPLSYALDTLYLEVVGCLGWQITRANQMVTQYPWLYERATRLAGADAATWEGLGLSQAKRKRNDDARNALKRALALDGQRIDSWKALAEVAGKLLELANVV